MSRIVNLGVLVSGSGSNLQSIIDRVETGSLPAAIRIVVSNNPAAFALERARKHGIPATVIAHEGFANREDYDRRLVETLNAHGVELVVLAGFMRVLSPFFLRAFPMRVMNIHPALLPSFPGTHGQRKAFDYGVKFSGCTVHFADEGVDTGPVIIQAVVPVYDADTEETLSQRILREEHRIYPQAIRLYAEGKLRVEGRKVRVLDHPQPDGSPRHNPPVTDF
ncbi:MAG: Phosphoribosylglycinamide formyltransferase [Syntrophaceae bacterium PtaB.Bin038]|nr:MAG: Phosphoribosylglycinamide formyltransferase [Syntrophaceae bacterium PtaB.Bin038]